MYISLSINGPMSVSAHSTSSRRRLRGICVAASFLVELSHQSDVDERYSRGRRPSLTYEVTSIEEVVTHSRIRRARGTRVVTRLGRRVAVSKL